MKSIKIKTFIACQTECWGYYNKDSWLMYHREDGPAATYKDGSKYWWRHNKLHREDGPAIEHPNGSNTGVLYLWYYHGERIDVSSQEDFERWLKYNKF